MKASRFDWTAPGKKGNVAHVLVTADNPEKNITVVTHWDREPTFGEIAVCKVDVKNAVERLFKGAEIEFCDLGKLASKEEKLAAERRAFRKDIA